MQHFTKKGKVLRGVGALSFFAEVTKTILYCWKDSRDAGSLLISLAYARI